MSTEDVQNKHSINLTVLLRRYLETFPEKKTKPTERFLVSAQAKKIIKRIVHALEYLGKTPFDFFYGYDARDFEFERMLCAKEFNIAQMNLPSPLIEIVQYFKQEDSQIINITSFCN